MANDYWSRAMQARFSRRRALVASGGAGVAAAFLAACGGSDSGSSKSDKSGLVSVPVETTKQAKRGGVFKDFIATDAGRGFDPHLLEISLLRVDCRAYQTLVKPKPSPLKPADQDEIVGDFAESWEISPDKLRLTMKVRPQVKWDPRPPTNSRQADAGDVAFTWQTFAATASLRGDFANAVNPGAPITSVQAPDNQTVVINLAFPFGDILPMLSLHSSAYVHIIPKEAGGAFSVRQDMRGSGPWILSEYVPSARMTWERNPSFWMKDQPFVDKWEMPILPEYAAGLAQFRTGNIYRYPVRSEDIIQMKKEEPRLVMWPTDVTGSGGNIFWGFSDNPKNYFRDSRVRQAFSMAQDRDLFIDAAYNVSAFEKQGLPLETKWNTTILPYNTGPAFWADPQGKDFGENAKYFKYDIPEAKKLLAAAGYSNGFEFLANYITTAYYGLDFPKQCEVLLGMARDAGMTFTTYAPDFTTDWRPKFFDAKGDFEGMSMSLNSPGTVRNRPFSMLHTGGGQYRGFAADGRPRATGDPFLQQLCDKIKQEFDKDKTVALYKELQQYDAKTQYNPYFPGGASGFAIAWPVVGNAGVYFGQAESGRGDAQQVYTWIDDTKAPLKSA